MPQPFHCHLCDTSFRQIPERGWRGFAGVQLMEHLHDEHGLESHECWRAAIDQLYPEEAAGRDWQPDDRVVLTDQAMELTRSDESHKSMD